MQVHTETLKHVSTDSYTVGKRARRTDAGKTYEIKRWTVEVTIGKDRRAIRCSPSYTVGPVVALDSIDLYGLAVRFSSGEKVWPGSAVWWACHGQVNNLRPNIDKHGHFFLAGFFEDVAESAHRSMHNAVA